MAPEHAMRRAIPLAAGVLASSLAAPLARADGYGPSPTLPPPETSLIPPISSSPESAA